MRRTLVDEPERDATDCDFVGCGFESQPPELYPCSWIATNVQSPFAPIQLATENGGESLDVEGRRKPRPPVPQDLPGLDPFEQPEEEDAKDGIVP
jgi:hypothetical protein